MKYRPFEIERHNSLLIACIAMRIEGVLSRDQPLNWMLDKQSERGSPVGISRKNRPCLAGNFLAGENIGNTMPYDTAGIICRTCVRINTACLADRAVRMLPAIFVVMKCHDEESESKKQGEEKDCFFKM
jgi:hypothetical protein